VPAWLWPVVSVRSRRTAVTAGPAPAARFILGSYCMDAPAMHLEQHERGNHAVRSGTGGAEVTGACSGVCAGAHATNKPNGIAFGYLRGQRLPQLGPGRRDEHHQH
jgi:hypothetical protein